MAGGGLGGLLEGSSGAAAVNSSESIGTLLASIATAAIEFGIQVALFYVLQFRYVQIYKPAGPRNQRIATWRIKNGKAVSDASKPHPRAASLHEDQEFPNERDNDSSSDSPINARPRHAGTFPATAKGKTTAINRRLKTTLQDVEDKGLLAGLKEVFTKDNNEIISESGLDAYFFLRYLRMLLRIFIPMALLILPILLPINRFSGDASTGIGRISWSNIDNAHQERKWAHLILAILTVCWVCFVCYDELRNFIAIRQLYLTSPAHRMKASAKTVLVRSIPEELLSEQALIELYDVYPGSITKVWINRNYDTLDELVQSRAKIAKNLEGAETDLVKKCLQKAKDTAKRAESNKSAENSGIKGEHEFGQSLPILNESKDELDLRLKDFGGGRPALSRRSTMSVEKGSPGWKRFIWSTYKFVFGTVGGYGREYYKSRDRYHRDFQQGLYNVTATPPVTQESSWRDKVMFWRSKDDGQPDEHKLSASEEQKKDFYDHLEESKEDDEALWHSYIDLTERDTLREPLFGVSWLPGLPGISGKFDKIYYLRRELDRLNKEIDELQAQHSNDQKFPKMNSAFIQFEQQVAAHMACQTVSHYAPQTMAPRLLEVSPDDVIWGNMSIKWWDRYLRTGVVFILAVALVILYAVPVTFTGLLSKVGTIGDTYPWLAWLNDLPTVVIAVIQGALAPLLLSIILTLIPIIFRSLVRVQGVATRSDRELGVQQYYFIFLFIQVFLVVTLTSGLVSFLASIYENPGNAVTKFSENLPTASNYFFSYMIIQALGNSASELLQIGTLFMFFIFGPLFDSTPHAKWRRKIPKQNITWGTFFPPFTNFAVIGLIFSIISPFILVFDLITFSLFWLVQRYNIIHVTEFKNDTGGMLFPVAINQLFTGLYVLEICLVGLFFLARDVAGNVAAIPQAIIMIIVFLATILFQILLNRSFQPLINYLPIAFEDKAFKRDQICSEKYQIEYPNGLNSRDEEQYDSPQARAVEMKQFYERPVSMSVSQPVQRKTDQGQRPTLAEQGIAGQDYENHNQTPPSGPPITDNLPDQDDVIIDELYKEYVAVMDGDSIQTREREILNSFNHDALRAERPVVWLPHDELGISNDEMNRTHKRYKHIWLSNKGVSIDKEGKMHYADDALAPDYKPHVSV